MELRQLRYFVRVVELGGLGRAALDLGVVTSALSQQISRLETELSARLLQRSARGVVPTEAGLAFYREAQLALRHVEGAARAAGEARLSGSVSVGLAPTTGAMLGLPLVQAMRERHPAVRLKMVESLSGHLSAMLNARQLDLAVLFDPAPARRWSVMPLLTEKLYAIRARRPGAPAWPARMGLGALKGVPLVLPSGPHGLRSSLDAAFAGARLRANVAAEIDSLPLLMDAVRAGLGATVQPWAALARCGPGAAGQFECAELTGRQVRRDNLLCSLSDDELPPAALAARAVLLDCARTLVGQGQWRGARLHAGLHGS